jgi:hypothetical protein
VIVAGIIDKFLQGAVGSLAKDKVTNNLTPNQMELASFILNPQYYLAEKGVNKIADILGYGSDYRNLSTDEKSDKAYYKEIMRNTVGDMLPESLGDIVRATPRMTDDEYEARMQELRQSASTPEATARFENTVRDMNYGTQTPGQGKYVGPLPEDNPMFGANVSNLPYDLKSTPTSGAPDDFDPALLASIIRGDSSNTVDNSVTDDMGNITITDTKNTNTPSGDFVNTRSLSTPITESVAPTGYTFDANIGAVVPATSTESVAPVGSVYDANIGANVPVKENVAPMGYTFDVNTGTIVPAAPEVNSAPTGYTFDMDTGTVVPVQEMPFEPDYYGGGGGKLENYYYSEYRRGGQIQKGKR